MREDKSFYSFRVIDRDCREFTIVRSVFSRVIEPLYGEQQEALKKIGRGVDRLCEMLFDGERAVGLIVYKKELQASRFELKTLCLINPSLDSKKGYGTKLMYRVMELAYSRQATEVLVTVSSGAQDSLHFFQKKGFLSEKEEHGKYQHGLTEYTLKARVNYELSSKRRRVDETAEPAPRLSANSNLSFFSHEHRKPGNHTCTLKSQYIRAIQENRKSFEGRVNSGYFKNYQVGDKVKWFAGDLAVETDLVSRDVYPNFRAMITAKGYKSLVPEARSIDDAVRIYESIPGYKEKSERFGVVALGIRVINPHLAQAASQTIGHKRSFSRSS